MMTNPRRRSQSRASNRGASPDMGSYMLDLMTAFEKGVADETVPYDLSPLEFSVLRICLQERECTATELARLLPVDASRVSRMVTKLVDKGYLRRRRLRNDRRVVMLRLSEAGVEFTSQLHQRVQVYYSRLTEGLSTDEMREFANASLLMIANYRQMKRDAD